MDHIPELNDFINAKRSEMLRYLKPLVKILMADIRRDKSLYKESPDDEPSIDIRLVIDKPLELSERYNPPSSWTWGFNTGCVDYDAYHSDYCAASSVGLNTKAEELLEELLGQVAQ